MNDSVIMVPKDADAYTVTCSYCGVRFISTDEHAPMAAVRKHIRNDCDIHPLRRAIILIRHAVDYRNPDYVGMAAFLDGFGNAAEKEARHE